MVHGLQHFADSLVKFQDHYVLVGGAAGDLMMSSLGENFRSTKDLDIVVLVRPNPDFLKALAAYIKDGEYENREKFNGSPQYYRFDKPKKSEFPKQIELFSKRSEDFELFDQQYIVPIQSIEIGDQFSAILLEDEYYDIIKENVVDGEKCKFINAIAQILFKARAFCELSQRKENGHLVDDRDIRKHRNDILMLTQGLPNGESISISGLPLQHLQMYLDELEKLQSDVGIIDFCKSRNLGSLQDLIRSLKLFYISG